jgi:hypothetical protein
MRKILSRSIRVLILIIGLIFYIGKNCYSQKPVYQMDVKLNSFEIINPILAKGTLIVNMSKLRNAEQSGEVLIQIENSGGLVDQEFKIPVKVLNNEVYTFNIKSYGNPLLGFTGIFAASLNSFVRETFTPLFIKNNYLFHIDFPKLIPLYHPGDWRVYTAGTYTGKIPIDIEVINLETASLKVITDRNFSGSNMRKFKISVKDLNSNYPIQNNNIIYDITIKNLPTREDYNNYFDIVFDNIFQPTFPQSSVDIFEREKFRDILKSELLDLDGKSDFEPINFSSKISITGGPEQTFSYYEMGSNKDWSFELKISCPGYYFVNKSLTIKPKKYWPTEIEVLMVDVGAKIRVSDNNNASKVIVN